MGSEVKLSAYSYCYFQEFVIFLMILISLLSDSFTYYFYKNGLGSDFT